MARNLTAFVQQFLHTPLPDPITAPLKVAPHEQPIPAFYHIDIAELSHKMLLVFGSQEHQD